VVQIWFFENYTDLNCHKPMIINVFEEKINCHSAMNTVSLRVTIKLIRELPIFTVR
jgi:hypothetical protein